jgi:hypothetical protein
MTYEYFATAVLAAILVAGGTYVSLKRRREAPLRRQVKAQRITFMATVEVKHRASLGMTASGDKLQLFVREDAVQISHPIPPLGFLLAQEWYFQARDITIEVSKNRWNREWIVIEGRSAGRDVWLSMTNRKQLRSIWDALVAAGAQPRGLPPIDGLRNDIQMGLFLASAA